MPQRSASSARGGQAASVPIGDEGRQFVAIQLNPRVLAGFRKEAKRRGVGRSRLGEVRPR